VNKNLPNILVVDDSATFRKMIVELLVKKGYCVESASSGEEALKMFKNGTYQIVLTDIILPGMSGLNLLKLIKEIKPDIDVIIVSGNDSSYTAIKALRLGAYDFIVKPVDDETILYNVVERTLEKQALTLENRSLVNDLSAKNRELQTTLKMMQSLNSLCALIASSLDIGEILRMLVECAVEELRAQKGYLLLLDKSGTNFSMKVCVGIDHNLAKTFTLTSSQGISGMVAASNRPLRIETDIPATLTHRLLEEDVSGDLFSTPGILSVPLLVKGKVVGVVNISGRSNGTMFTDTEVEFITTLAGFAAIALENAGNFYKLKKNGA
jgi:CheY-like chemotaxis protein